MRTYIIRIIYVLTYRLPPFLNKIYHTTLIKHISLLIRSSSHIYLIYTYINYMLLIICISNKNSQKFMYLQKFYLEN
uniref:Uncharacterized protein n=1 Tax=Pleurastrum terricola TaxID=34116 RepID=A6YGB9_PLETE|nr:hypothetical protein LeteCp064 [Pleurastrum terricola]ABO69364.1 hypothetical protein [Pleurastrum terricola]